MEIKVIGFQEMNFTDRSTGNPVEGTRVYYAYADRYITGNGADHIFIRKGNPNPFELNKRFIVTYDRYGKFDLNDVKKVD